MIIDHPWGGVMIVNPKRYDTLEGAGVARTALAEGGPSPTGSHSVHRWTTVNLCT